MDPRDISHGEPVEFLTSILSAVPWFITRVGTDYRIQHINRLQNGYDFSGVVGREVFEFIDPEFHEAARHCFEEVLNSRTGSSYESRAIGPDGQRTSYINYVAPLLQDREPIGLCIVGVDLTEREERERSLRERQSALDLIVDTTGIGLWRWNVQTGEMFWNERFREICGCTTTLTFEKFLGIVHPDDREIIHRNRAQMMATNEVVQEACRLIVNGEVRWGLQSGQATRDENGDVLYLTGAVLDITERKQTEEHLAQAQKIDAIGQLATGIAHNFNNMLMTLVPTLELLDRSATDAQRSLIAEALTVTERAAEMVRQLMEFAGGSAATRPVPIEVNHLVRESVQLCERTFERPIDVQIHALDSFWVLGDANPLMQVIMNLLLNSRDAMREAETRGPTIDIELTVAPPSLVAPTGAEAQHVLIQVTDNGPGMRPSVRKQAFEPFFTTKQLGTGMGLPSCKAIIQRFGGWMTCEPGPGGGCRVSVFLPRYSSAAHTSDSAEPPTRVLIIDDEPQIREVVARILFERGEFLGQCVASAAEAVEVIDSGARFEVILLDRTMPEFSGRSLLPELRRLLPEAAILYFSGEHISDAELELVDGFVPKPIGVKSLIEAVRRHTGRDSAERDEKVTATQ